MDNPLKAMILAAGFGQRARPLSLVRPKPLFPVLNRPLISHTLDRLAEAGVREVVVNTHHLAKKFEKYLFELNTNFNINTVREDVILGTGGGVRNARSYLGPDPFILINADIKTDVNLGQVYDYHLENRSLVTMVLHDYPRFNQVTVDRAGWIHGFRGQAPEVEAESNGWRLLAFTGIHVVSPEVLERIPDGPGDILTVYRTLIDEGRPVRAYIAEKPRWWDAGTMRDYLDLHGVLLTERSEGPVLIDESATIGPGVEIKGWACLGQGATLEAGARVKDSVLWPGAGVSSGVKIDGCVLADGSRAVSDLTGQALIP